MNQVQAACKNSDVPVANRHRQGMHNSDHTSCLVHMQDWVVFGTLDMDEWVDENLVEVGAWLKAGSQHMNPNTWKDTAHQLAYMLHVRVSLHPVAERMHAYEDVLGVKDHRLCSYAGC